MIENLKLTKKQEEERFKTDKEGKAIATVFFNHFGFSMTATTDEFNRLDGAFEASGKVYGVEVKWLSTDRYYEHDDILIAKDKYEYSIGEGKEASGLERTFKFDYTKTEDGIIAFTTDFSNCEGMKTKTLWLPIGNYKGAPKKPTDVYPVPRSKAKKWKITDEKIEQIL